MSKRAKVPVRKSAKVPVRKSADASARDLPHKLLDTTQKVRTLLCREFSATVHADARTKRELRAVVDVAILGLLQRLAGLRTADESESCVSSALIACSRTEKGTRQPLPEWPDIVDASRVYLRTLPRDFRALVQEMRQEITTEVKRNGRTPDMH
jgi:hypothetical protein